MGKGPMVIAAVLITVAVIAQSLAVGLPGWKKYQELKSTKAYSEGLWMRCEGNFENCITWLDEIIDKAKNATKQILQNGQLKRVDYTNEDICVWFTLMFGLLMLLIAMFFSLLGLCCCDGVAKFVILMLGMLAASSILIGNVVYGVSFADEKEKRATWENFQLYYCYGLSVGASGLTYIAALVAAFYDTYDK